MRAGKFLFYIVIAAIAAIVYSLFTEKETDHSAYIDELIAHRADKENFMKNSEESPFIEQNAPFHALSYFDPDPDFVINARFDIRERQEKLTLATSDGKEKTYWKYADISFRKNGESHQLLLLKPISEEDYLFLPFTDATSTNTTYGGGRYLEVVEPKRGNTVVLDFNKAYNPYCAYVDGYSCPFPPAENNISLAVTAGEKNYESSENDGK